MKRTTPGGIWALRAVTATITIIVLVVVGTIAYSTYQDYSVIRSELPGTPNQPTGRIIQQGNTATVYINITIPNRGLYTLNVTVTCDRSNPNVVCAKAQVSVPAGGEQVLRVKMTVLNLQQYLASSNRRINGTVTAALEPFVSMTVVTDLSGLVKIGGP